MAEKLNTAGAEGAIQHAFDTYVEGAASLDAAQNATRIERPYRELEASIQFENARKWVRIAKWADPTIE